MNDALDFLTSSDVKSLNPKIAILPIGAYEQHGEYLPLNTDTVIATQLARKIAEKYPLWMLPALSFSCSHEHAAFAGTISLSSKTLCSVVDDIYCSLVDQGISKLVIVNAHGGNYVLQNFLQERNMHARNIAQYPTGEDWKEIRSLLGLSSAHEDMHAGEVETSILLAIVPDAIKEGYQNADFIHNERRFLNLVGVQAYSESGVIGYPSKATPEKGQEIIHWLVNNFKHTYDNLI